MNKLERDYSVPLLCQVFIHWITLVTEDRHQAEGSTESPEGLDVLELLLEQGKGQGGDPEADPHEQTNKTPEMRKG